MQEELLDFYNLLVVRNQLATIDRSKLVEIYQDKNAYFVFLDTIGTIINEDIGFLLLNDELPKKIFEIIGIHRFDEDMSWEVKDYINDVITAINEMQVFPDEMKKIILGSYVVHHGEVREKMLISNENILKSLALDAVMFVSLTDGKTDLVKDDDYALASLNYLMKAAPILFADEEVNKNARVILDNIDKKSKGISIRKIKVKNAKKNYMSINEGNMI